ncbi:MotA/TolQ/ExbB proton channel family protein [Mixta gaviniae]|uniref:Biopolymer transporter ExbB n=1 Tax=Mixta gaviniae TaxID=665914 RepID=A0A1X1DYH1_9GAMM|nr:MotA/TolQ/ExbB proton channel family protein [Mixta gaviniae]AUX94702.1 biopolymer transporter ExbB [Mixta gaviniae]ORM81717.1 biopolymer transporter ExbB [Mixta gaviniae]
MNATLLHDIIFWIMYFSLAVALVIIIERAISFAWTTRQATQLEQALTPQVRHIEALPAELLRRRSLPLRTIQPILMQKDRHNAQTLNDLVDAQYLLSKPQLTRGLWLLETIVTAAPLLGLLGTVMGIIDTFKALSASGVSEPSLVSAGMGTALYATGLGIAIALISLVGNNYLQSRMERISELLKVLLIRAAGAALPHSEPAGSWMESGAQRYA